MSVSHGRRSVPRPSSAPRTSSSKSHAGSPLDFIRATSQTSQPLDRPRCGVSQQLKQKRLDPCVLAAVASRPHSSAASRRRSATRAENTADWIHYELPNGQQPSDFADVIKIEYMGDASLTRWRLSFGIEGLIQKDGDASFFVRVKKAISDTLFECFRRGSKETSPRIVVDHICRTNVCKPESSSWEFVASLGITFPEDAKLKITAEESVLGTVHGSVFANAFVEHLTRFIGESESPEIVANIKTCLIDMVLEHPSEIVLSGGHGEPVTVAELPKHGREVRYGIGEGFELLWYEMLDKDGKRWCKVTDFNHSSPNEIFAKGNVELPIKITFRSPMTNLPNLSERQLAERLRLLKVREFHFRRLIIELKHDWKNLTAQSKVDLHTMFKACGEDLVLRSEVQIGISQCVRRLPEGITLREADDTKPLRLQDLPNLRVPVTIRVGTPTDEQPRVTLRQFRKALRRAGITWLSLEKEEDLFAALTPSEEDETQYGDTAWEMSLANYFVMDTEGRFVHIQRVAKANHILGVTRALQRRVRERSAQDGFDGTLSFSDFQTAMTLGGIVWLGREQVEEIFKEMSSGESGGISLSDWLSRFQWEPISAVTEVQRALEEGPAKIVTKKSITGRRQRSTAKPCFDLNFYAFQSRLFDLGVSYLTVEQQRIIFDTIDVDRSGTITEDELAKVADVRRELEEEREAAVAQEMEERKAEEAKRAEEIAARVQAAEAERQAEIEQAKAAFEEKFMAARTGGVVRSPTKASLSSIGTHDLLPNSPQSKADRDGTTAPMMESAQETITQPFEESKSKSKTLRAKSKGPTMEEKIEQTFTKALANNTLKDAMKKCKAAPKEVITQPPTAKSKTAVLAGKLEQTFTKALADNTLIDSLKTCKVSSPRAHGTTETSGRLPDTTTTKKSDVASTKRNFGEKLKLHAEDGTLSNVLQQAAENITQANHVPSPPEEPSSISP